MSTAPIPTGKIRGSLSDVTQKLQNFVGAVKVTTSSGKGGILVNMGRPVASYLAVGGVLHRGKESLDLLEKEELAEYEILRYDEEQFREAVIICENRGLLLEGEKGAAPGAPPRAREAKPREEENVLSAMMKRFAIPKIGERQETAQPVPEAGAGVPSPPPVAPVRKEEPLPEPQTPAPAAKKVPAPGREIPSSPPPETELSAIIKRLRDSGRIEKGPAPAPVPEEPARSTGPAPAGEESRPSPLEEILPEAPARASGSTPTPEAPASEERVRVDLGKMMKRIKRLDITSIRKELQEGAEEPGASG
ncbi:MAG: hypothetical protein LUQ23_02795, partial [Methanomicrobiales archaeon]|nr:hypothetical protein [Methanomicrobiales archaeon]